MKTIILALGVLFGLYMVGSMPADAPSTFLNVVIFFGGFLLALICVIWLTISIALERAKRKPKN